MYMAVSSDQVQEGSTGSGYQRRFGSCRLDSSAGMDAIQHRVQASTLAEAPSLVVKRAKWIMCVYCSGAHPDHDLPGSRPREQLSPIDTDAMHV